jgi:hypothetical protein
MINRKNFLIFGFSAFTALSVLLTNTINAEPSKNNTNIIKTPASINVPTEQPAVNFKTVNPLELVLTPQGYLNNNIKFVATFDKFSTLGLDYEPAFRDSKKYISLLIKRPDVQDHTIPLSELKLIIQREKAEKLIDMESGDQIELTGQVFSSALNDPWVDVDNIKILTSKAKASSDKNKKEIDKVDN